MVDHRRRRLHRGQVSGVASRGLVGQGLEMQAQETMMPGLEGQEPAPEHLKLVQLPLKLMMIVRPSQSQCSLRERTHIHRCTPLVSNRDLLCHKRPIRHLR